MNEFGEDVDVTRQSSQTLREHPQQATRPGIGFVHPTATPLDVLLVEAEEALDDRRLRSEASIIRLPPPLETWRKQL
jgi:hypothetical protein